MSLDAVAPPARAAADRPAPAGPAVEGRATPFVVVAPIRAGRLTLLLLNMRLVRRIPSFRLDRAALVHVAQWGVLARQRGQLGRPGRLRRSLVFVSVFDGEIDQYIVTFASLLPRRFGGVFGACVGFPGSTPSGPLLDYIGRHRYDSQFFYAAYDGRTMCDIRSALWLAGELRELALDAASLSDAALRSRLRRLAHGRDRDARLAHATPPLTLIRKVLRGHVDTMTLTTLAPVRLGHEHDLRMQLEAMQTDGTVEGFDRITGTHYARFAVIDPLFDADDRRMDYAPAQLLFSVQFDRYRPDRRDDDREIAAYLGQLYGALRPGGDARMPWVHCEGFPDNPDSRLFIDFLRTGAVPTGLYRSTTTASAPTIRRALALDDRFAALRSDCLDRDGDDQTVRRMFAALVGDLSS